MLQLSRNGLILQSLTSLDESQGSSNVKVSIQNDGTYTNYSTQLHYGYYVHGFSYTKGIARYENGVFILPREAFEQYGLLNLSVLLVSSDEELMTNQVQFIVQAAPRGDMVIDDIPSAQQQVLQLVQTTLDQYAHTINLNKNEIAVLKSRMDSFTSLQQGSTTGDAELIDGRVGHDGKTYENIGDAIRGQVSQLSDDFGSITKKIKSTNLLNPEKLTVGYLGTDCELNTSAGRITEFIEVEPNTTYTGKDFGVSGVWSSWFFREADLSSNISIIPSTTFTTPEDCHYIRLVFYSESVAIKSMLVKGEEYPVEYIEYIPDYFMLSDKIIDEVTNAVSENIETYIERYNNNFWDHEYGRCNVNKDTHVIQQSDNGSLYGSNYFPVFPFCTYISSLVAKGFCFFYDENMEYVSSLSDDDVVIRSDEVHVFTIINPKIKFAFFSIQLSLYSPDNTFIRVYNDSNDFFDVNSNLAKTIVERTNATYTFGKKWACLGDSITYGYSLPNPEQEAYSTLVAKATGLIPYNYGYSGSRITAQGDTSSDKYIQSMVVRYVNMISDADVITVFGGINDANNALPIGEYGSKDIFTFYGALDNMIRGLQEKYPGKAIGFITPLNYGNDEKHLKYVEAMIDICGKYSIPVLDMYHNGQISTMTGELNNLYFADGLHPNELGHRVIARKIANFIGQL